MKKIIAIMVIVLCLIGFTGCDFSGYDFVDSNYHFDKAMIKMPDGSSITVSIKKWADSADGEQLTITAEDGTIYLVNSVNCVLIKE